MAGDREMWQERPEPQPNRLRRAWCEITGGHYPRLLHVSNNARTTHARFRCRRCGWKSPWLLVTAGRAALAEAEGKGGGNG